MRPELRFKLKIKCASFPEIVITKKGPKKGVLFYASKLKVPGSGYFK